MKKPFSFYMVNRHLWFLALWLVVVVIPANTQAQVTLPTAAPISTIAPIPVPTPVPLPTVAPNTTVIGPVTDLSAYKQLRRPTAIVALAFPVGTNSGVPTQTAAISAASGMATATGTVVPITTLQPQLLEGVFSTINLGTISGTMPLPAASVTLQFDASNAGTLVWVQPLDGGTLQAQGPEGPVTVQGGFWIELDATGRLNFTFQAPTASARYQVLIRLDNVATVLPFVVPDPAPNS